MVQLVKGRTSPMHDSFRISSVRITLGYCGYAASDFCGGIVQTKVLRFKWSTSPDNYVR